MNEGIVIKLLKIALGLAAMLMFASSAVKAGDEIYTGFLSKSALGGYDTVAYFSEGKAVKGDSDYQTRYKGADWYFASEANLVAFKSDPQRYAPQYGGYCAWAVAEGYTAKGDPLYWKVYQGKLYLNYNESIKNQWLEDIDRFIEQANKNWPGVIN